MGNNRIVSVVVLVLTTALILGGVWLLRGGTPEGAVSEVTVAEGGGRAPRVGESAADFAALTIDEAAVRLSDYEGRPVWLMFNATWCASCRAENPDVQAAHLAHDDVEVLAVYLGETTRDVAPYAEKLGLSYTHLVDPTTQVSAQYQVRGVPMHFFIDADGSVRSVRAGTLNRAQMDEELAKIAG
ncbi:TlpA family protein disulfide reductase [Tessaracoccus sp. MC1865]|uniref:TlpA family protein disulfide reductase n=1 Tax=Tessaracoccus sp. MC1865 TaxID=2760310 RepID=UPI0015FECDB6|nr:TlpA disulfide reductase family protein [Tessaracoccus sp. MC1865]MBB1483910.1 TlpA family protein disulfide reductase [Tessaracoccus sp. MC1865]QTO36961.1 TlpA family protein disulfide reductase [Tessaracoccus sp. MC1865]